MIVVNEICNWFVNCKIFQGKEQERKKKRKKRIQKKLQVNDYSYLKYVEQTKSFDLVIDDDLVFFGDNAHKMKFYVLTQPISAKKAKRKEKKAQRKWMSRVWMKLVT